MATRTERARRTFTIEEYERMVDTGIIARDERVELIDGEIVEMTPIGDPHAAALATLNRLLVLGLGTRAVVWPQGPVRIPPRSLPQPDLALLGLRSYRQAGPMPQDVLLVIEVSDTSLRFDRTKKLSVYARAGIPEYWIVEATGRRVAVYRHPEGDTYRDRVIVPSAGTIAPTAFPDVVIRVADIFA